MEGNRDEAEKCIELASRSMKDGNFDKAERLLLKSERLFPTTKAKDLLEKLRTATGGGEDDGLRRRQFSSQKKEEPAFKQSESKENVEANKEHMDAVKRIKKCKDYYEMLGITKEATDSEIKKAYKKLALQLHPDKNKSPGAAEAFKALGNAAGVLTDPEKRKQYDLYGGDDERMQQMNSRGSDTTFQYTRGFEADVTAEELFNMFFGAGFPQNANVHYRRNGRVYRTQPETHTGRGGEAQHGSGVILQLLPIIVLIILSMMSSFFVADPIYSLHHSSKFPVQRNTVNLKIPYYVKENFHNEYQGGLRRLEMTIEEEYISNLRHACYKERVYKDGLLYKAKTWGNHDLFTKAQNQELPSCDLLAKIHQRVG